MNHTSVSLRFKLPFGARGRRQREAGSEPPSRVARMIALAHHIDGLVERGVVSSYGEVGRALGLSDTRMVQVMDLVLLSPRIQEALLFGEVVMSPRRAQKLVRRGTWEAQERGLGERIEAGACHVVAEG
ncbi:MAG: hypothetical protein IPN34_16565 [Planctomycetes bacterium]|nr:hypothetical protein [Planctomycetota bacterium]